MISVEQALGKVEAGFSTLAAETVALPEALGRVLAENVAARLSHPPSAVSAMDGYAVRAGDVAAAGGRLTRIGESQAGKGFAGSIAAGECVRIFTGAPLPGGADAIVIQEDTVADGAQITINEAPAAGQHARPKGLDFKLGDVLLEAGRLLNARDIGLAAAMNVPWLRVTRRPRVAILATGDEIVMPGEPMSEDQIISSNSVALAAYVRALGGVPINLGIAGDTAEALREALDGVRGADLLVTSGGASVGDYDLVGQVLGEKGLNLGFYKVAMRPGKPLIFGDMGGVPVLGLPGNPVSCGVTAAVFLRPAMAIMLGIRASGAAPETALAGRDLPENGPRQDYMRAAIETDSAGNPVATPFQAQDSAMMANLARAHCLVVRPPLGPPVGKGQRVPILRLDGALGGF